MASGYTATMDVVKILDALIVIITFLRTVLLSLKNNVDSPWAMMNGTQSSNPTNTPQNQIMKFYPEGGLSVSTSREVDRSIRSRNMGIYIL